MRRLDPWNLRIRRTHTRCSAHGVSTSPPLLSRGESRIMARLCRGRCTELHTPEIAIFRTPFLAPAHQQGAGGWGPRSRAPRYREFSRHVASRSGGPNRQDDLRREDLVWHKQSLDDGPAGRYLVDASGTPAFMRVNRECAHHMRPPPSVVAPSFSKLLTHLCEPRPWRGFGSPAGVAPFPVVHGHVERAA